MKKAIAIILSIILIMAVTLPVSAISSKPVKIDPKKLVQVTQLIYDRGTIPSSEGNLEMNWFTKRINKNVEKLGIKIKFVPVPSASREQKLAVMIASSQAPDICVTYDQVLLQNYTRNGGLLDMLPYMDKFGGEIKKIIGETRLEQSKIDGKLTRIFSNQYYQSDSTFIRQDWLDLLGMKAPTNIDELYAYLKAVKEKDPGKVGDKLIPFLMPGGDGVVGRAENDLLQAFLKESPSMEKIATPYQNWTETKDMYRFLNKLYNEKLTDFLILDKDQSQLKQKLMLGQVGATVNLGHFMVHSAYGNISENLAKNVPGAKYVATYPWKAAATKEAIISLFVNGPGNAKTFFIPKTAKDPEAAVKYLNYMASTEYTTLATKGIESVDYKMVDGIPTPLHNERFKDHNGWIEPGYMTLDTLYSTDVVKMVKNYATQFSEQYRNDYVKGIVVGQAITKYATPIINLATPMSGKYQANLTQKWNTTIAKSLMASVKDFDQVFDDGLKAWKSEGGDEVTKEALELYKQQYGK